MCTFFHTLLYLENIVKIDVNVLFNILKSKSNTATITSLFNGVILFK